MAEIIKRFNSLNILSLIVKPFILASKAIEIGQQARADYEVARLLQRYEYRDEPFEVLLEMVRTKKINTKKT